MILFAASKVSFSVNSFCVSGCRSSLKSSLVPAAIALTSAKRTELYLLAHKNTRSPIKKVLYIYKHLRQCDNIQHIQGLYNLPDIFSNKTGPPSTTNKEFFTETVRSNTKIIDSDDNWNLLLYKEAYHIKRSSPSLNNGLKASRELCLFS